MSWISSMKWYSGAASASLAPLIYGIGDPLAAGATKVKGPFGVGARAFYPLGVTLGALQMAHLVVTNRAFIAREAAYASDRITGRDNPDAWKHTPKKEFGLRHKHGYLVSGRDRMRRNPHQDRWTVHKQDYAREGIVWMP